MVEGDLVDLTLTSLLHALSHDRATAVLKVQRGNDQGSMYFADGALVHALAGRTVGDQAVQQLLQWPDGRFRLMRDADAQPRTITHPLADFLPGADRDRVTAEAGAPEPGDRVADAALLDELLGLITQLEQDRARLAEGRIDRSPEARLVVVTAMANSLIAVVTARCSDPNVLPSRVLARLAETQPYTQLLGEEQERITVGTAAAVLKNWKGDAADRQRMLQDLCGALVDVLAMYCRTAATLFHNGRQREQWRAMSEVFVEDLRSAVMQAA